MVEKARRAPVAESHPAGDDERVASPEDDGETDGDGDPADADREWEILAREDADDPPRYVGTVRAADAAAAHEEATRLFCWYDREVWVCPAGAIRRFSVAEAEDSEAADAAVPESGTEGRTHEL
ncbi:Htur_1727 family rSAM-partnered candidate RiPP [Halorussus gelatinilyticus]|uniref:Htur_1727 family rSAM-partnered candidate RiPP n=1 Tax=Halorussus gelatinilyticus TaxID=2937524 RepID=A0A8U0IFF3_9EURY|nr:Htur_1727 family rSAM-partnered candidate RiPP [Halorussus gelatinilyticus]UPV99702.1 Htur_1727 family rSAM-partnered candidate RiPP [Halorussus gelatinilyticus]